MGNQVTTLGQIYPVEYYLVDYCNDITIDGNLGSTRFMKVARVKHRDAGYCVAKIYAINEPNIPIQEHKSKLEFIGDTLQRNGELNSLPFLQCLINDKCIILLRQYIKYNLYDRLSTRPFLTSIEKRWISYQLLRCIQSLHKNNIYHGDIKSENVLVTSFLWITLADFASYKPVTLPENNPSDFSYFFDTSRRHCCNMAPERFVEQTIISASDTDSTSTTTTTTTTTIPANEINKQIAYDNNFETNQLTPQMDLFSLGCVFAELFSDDTPNSSIFDLGQILMFKKNQYNPTKFIEEGISDTRVRRLILNLIDLDPNKRNSASHHLDQLVPSLFPAYFQTLYNYFAKLIPLTPDAKILILDKDLDKLLEEIITEDEHGLLLPLILATSTLRSLKSIDAKLIGIRLCVRLVESSPTIMSEYIIDRLLPYIIQMLSKSESRVRALCISSLNTILKHVDRLQTSDANVFIDYILPNLLPLAHDTSTLVRISLASNIGDLAETAKLLQSEREEKDLNHRRGLLQEAFATIVSQLLVDPNNNVRRAILNENVTKLCNFFEAEKTNEVILSHMITFLNDKSDFRLRATFFDNISNITASIGPYYAFDVKPLMQKGLADSEELVIYKCLKAITSMITSGLLAKDVIYELFQEAVPFLSFPNKWIRNSVIEFILILSKPEYQSIDFNKRILPAIKLHLDRDIHGLLDEVVLLDSLQNPLPRIVIESILNGEDDIDQIFHSITKRKMSRDKKRYRTISDPDNQDYVDQLNRSSTSMAKRNSSEKELLVNVDRYSEDKLIDSELILRKIHKNKRTSSSKQIEPNISIRQDEIVQNKKQSSISSTLTKITRPRGILLAHLQEHKGAINKLISVPGTSVFVSCSSDATVKFWDCGDVATKSQVLFRSRQTFISPDAGSINTICAFLADKKLLALTDCNNLQIVQLSDLRLLKTINLDSTTNPNSTKLELVTNLVALSPNSYATSSTSSNIRGYDLRLPTNSDVWNLKMNGSDGLITCMDGNEFCIACGTSSSIIAMFDLRFYIKATTMSYPPYQDRMRKRIRQILLCSDAIYCSVDGNNEVSTWDCESASRTKTLWASPAPCLSSTQSSHHSVLSMVVDSSRETNSVITAGDDMKIRYWDLNNPHKSYIVSKNPLFSGVNSSTKSHQQQQQQQGSGASGAPSSGSSSVDKPGSVGGGGAKQQISTEPINYRSKLVDGIQVIHETRSSSTTTTNSMQTNNPESLSTAHHDTISCLATVNSLLLSASRDGVIKIWR